MSLNPQNEFDDAFCVYIDKDGVTVLKWRQRKHGIMLEDGRFLSDKQIAADYEKTGIGRLFGADLASNPYLKKDENGVWHFDRKTTSCHYSLKEDKDH